MSWRERHRRPPSSWNTSLEKTGLDCMYRAVLSKWEIFIKMRVAESLPSFDIEQSFINQKVLFLYKNNSLLSEKPSNVPFSMRIHGFMTFLLLHFVSSKGERREKWQQGHKWAAAASALSLKLMQFSLRGRGGHTNGQIEQNCAINCGIQWNATNKSITKYENLFGVKSIFESIQRFARYRIGTLILIGRLCIRSNESTIQIELNIWQIDIQWID